MSWSARVVPPEKLFPLSRREVVGLSLLLVVLFVWTLAPLAGYDFWFYLAVGREIWETREVPWAQSYLGSTAEMGFARYADMAWLGNLFCYLVFLVGGPLGLVALKSFLLSSITGLAYLGCRLAGMAPFWAGAWSTLGLWTIRGRFEMRTYLLTDLALAALVALVIALESRGQLKRRDLVAAVALFTVWANLHQGILAGFVLLGCWVVFGRLPWKQRVVFLAAALAGSLLKPYAIHFPAFLYDHFANSSAIGGVVEWAAPPPAVLVYQLGPLYLAVLALAAFLIVTVSRRRRLDGCPPWAFGMLAVLFLALASRSIRSISELLPVVVPLLAAYMPALPSDRSRRGLVAASLLLLLAVSFQPRNLLQLDRVQGYPEFLVEALPEQHGQLFNSFEFGNYLVFRGIAPFLHGMTGLYQEQLITDFEDVLNPTPRREAILEKFGVGAALLHLPQDDDATYSLVEYLAESPHWKLELWDDTGLLFVRGPRESGLTAVRPWRSPAWSDPTAAEAELLALVSRRPSAIAHRLLSQLQLARGEVASALRQAEATIRLSPYFASGWTQLGLCYVRSGNLEGARQASERAVALAPNDASLRFNLALVLRETSQQRQGASAHWYRWRALWQLRQCLRLQPDFEPARALRREL